MAFSKMFLILRKLFEHGSAWVKHSCISSTGFPVEMSKTLVLPRASKN